MCTCGGRGVKNVNILIDEEYYNEMNIICTGVGNYSLSNSSFKREPFVDHLYYNNGLIDICFLLSMVDVWNFWQKGW